MQSSIEICLHYGGIMVKCRQGYDYVGGDSIMVCGVNTYEFFYNQCCEVGAVLYRLPGRSISDSCGISIIEEDSDLEWLYRHSVIGDVVDIYILPL